MGSARAERALTRRAVPVSLSRGLAGAVSFSASSSSAQPPEPSNTGHASEGAANTAPHRLALSDASRTARDGSDEGDLSFFARGGVGLLWTQLPSDDLGRIESLSSFVDADGRVEALLPSLEVGIIGFL